MRQYQEAMNCYLICIEAAGDGNVDRQKLALYRAGVLAAGLRDSVAAEKHLSQLVKLDPDFKDAASRLDRLKQIRDKG
jgi:hypothetical protein